MIHRLEATEENVLYVRSIFGHPEIGPFISTDGFDLEDFPYEDMLESSKHYFLCASSEGERAGLFFFHEWNPATAWSHALLTPGFRGKVGLGLGKEAVAWMFENTRYRKLLAAVPETNRRAKLYVSMVGYREEGRIRGSFPRDGKLHDEVIMGINKGG